MIPLTPSQIERVLAPAARANCLDRTVDVPVAVPRFDVDAAAVIIRRQENRRLLAAALPAGEDAGLGSR
jgi:hypothetical protein